MKLLSKALRGALVAAAMTVTGAAHAGTVVIQSDQYSAATLNNFYNSYGGHTSTISSRPIDTINLAGVDLFWSVQPASSYTANEITALANYLSGGGRIAFMGEHGTFAPSENLRINGALTALGATMTIVNVLLDPGFQNATIADGQVLAHPLTAGVNTYQYAAFAPITISGSAVALMLGADQSSVMMAYQNIGAGSIFLITDQNVWDNAGSLWVGADNEVMFDNLVDASVVVPGIPEPTTWAMLIIGAGFTGGSLRRRRAAALRPALA